MFGSGTRWTFARATREQSAARMIAPSIFASSESRWGVNSASRRKPPEQTLRTSGPSPTTMRAPILAWMMRSRPSRSGRPGATSRSAASIGSDRGWSGSGPSPPRGNSNVQHAIVRGMPGNLPAMPRVAGRRPDRPEHASRAPGRHQGGLAGVVVAGWDGSRAVAVESDREQRLPDVGDPHDLHPVDIRRGRRRDRPPEPQAGRLGEPTRGVRGLAYLAAETDLTDRDDVRRDGRTGSGARQRARGREVGGRLPDAHATRHARPDVAGSERPAAHSLLQDGDHQRDTAGVETLHRAARHRA